MRIININFEKYTKYFNKSKDTILKEGIKIDYLDSWIGWEWYKIGKNQMLGFSYNDGLCGTAQVPLLEIYPELEKYNSMTRDDFEKYVKTDVSLIPFSEDSEFSSAFLLFAYGNINVIVFCDDYGTINITEAYCQFYQ